MNNANRLTNMDTANMRRTIETGLRQVEEIKLIDRALGVDNITNIKERELCKFRLANESVLTRTADLMSDKFKTPILRATLIIFSARLRVYERLVMTINRQLGYRIPFPKTTKELDN